MRVYHWGKTRTTGFTLLEVLVVVVIVSVLSTAFLLSLGSGRHNAGQEEARRFAALVRLAGQEAMLRSRDLAVEVAPKSYKFLLYEEQQWQALEDEVFRLRELPEGMSFTIQLDGSAELFAAISNKKSPGSDEIKELLPRIFIFSTGEMTSFEMTLNIEDSEYIYHISGSLNGKMRVGDNSDEI